MNEAIERANEDWRIWLVATRLRAKAGDREGAREALRRTRGARASVARAGDLLHAAGGR